MVPAFVKNPDEAFRAERTRLDGNRACCADWPLTPRGRETLRQRAFAYANPALTEARALYHRAGGRQSARPRQIAALLPLGKA